MPAASPFPVRPCLAGCAHKVTRQSYNQMSPFTPAMGLLSSAFAIGFTPGPERKAWDQLMGYPLILGIARHSSTTFADFQVGGVGRGVREGSDP